jgi:hypothetical protein
MSNAAALRTVWERRYAGTLAGGSDLLVALVMAELAESSTGALTVGVRALAEITGLGRSTVHRSIAAAGLFQRAERGAGHRASRYVLAASPRDANPVDKSSAAFRSVPPEGRYSVPRPPRSVPLASHNGPLAASPRDSELEPKTINRDLASHADVKTPPVEISDRVADLRRRMNGTGAP